MNAWRCHNRLSTYETDCGGRSYAAQAATAHHGLSANGGEPVGNIPWLAATRLVHVLRENDLVVGTPIIRGFDLMVLGIRSKFVCTCLFQLLLCSACRLQPLACAAESQWVTTGNSGRLIYVPDAGRGSDTRFFRRRLPWEGDCSHTK